MWLNNENLQNIQKIIFDSRFKTKKTADISRSHD